MKNVKQISLDILVDKNEDGCNLADAVADFLGANGYMVLGASFQDDLTDIYKENYPEYLKGIATK